MPFFLAIIGIILIITGFKGRANDLFPQMIGDSKGFIPLCAVVVLAAVFGEVKQLRGASTAFLILVILAYGLRSSNNIIAGFNAIIQGSKT